ncbi:distal membrane-arm assembly complex protein 2 [Sitophilus oryzae]|uniref:Distal membrane-arm assembly complex protein 2 n=1 Tax=Sitophilus oryzae TaxID=7048 RepID=A0A6J2XFY2_SITOR|nr:distal membrane-arm assembly complex protein 2 [Sitophilus oryzae]
MFNKLRLRRELFTIQRCKRKFSDKQDGPVNSKSAIESETSTKSESNQSAKDDVVWRTPQHNKQKSGLPVLGTFYKKEASLNLLKLAQTPVRLSTLKKWWMNSNEHKEVYLQHYIPERHQILGPELAAAHFIVYRGGSVKFHGQEEWIKADNGKYELPSMYQEMYLERMDCTDMNLHYEGLENLRGLKDLQWLSLNGNKYIDDFCMDVIANIFSHSLIYLDLRNCFNISERGIGALFKMKKLKVLYLDDLLKDTRYELTCMLLQDLNPVLNIKSDVISFEIK